MTYRVRKRTAKLQQKNEMRKFLNIILGIFLIFLTSCEGSDTSTALSSVARLSGFSFAKVDSMPGLAAAVFTIEERLDTGLVWNKDSILYGTKLDHVVPRFAFAATPGAAILQFPDTTLALTGYDTLDFTKRPVYLTIRSADRSTTKVYEIRPTVHQVDPELFTWTQLTEAVYSDPEDDREQRVVELDGRFIMITSNGFDLEVYSSSDAVDWSDLGDPAGLPAGTRVRQIVSDGHTLYYGQGNKIYTSPDAVTWYAHTVAYNVVTMIMYWNQLVWALTGTEDDYEFAIWEDDNLRLSGLKPEGEFPVSDFASVCFKNASGRQRAMVIGGFAENGRSLNTRWNFEYSSHPQPDGTYRVEEFSIDRPAFQSLTGVSVVEYDEVLMMFGGVDNNMQYFGRDIFLSINEGLTWDKADSAKNSLPEVYQARQKQTAIVRGEYIYLFGGQDAKRTYSDVYRGRLNSIGW